MNDEVLLLLKRVVFIQLFVGVLFALIMYLLAGNYAYIYLLGLIIAIINFFINSIVVNYSFKKEKKSNILFVFGFIARIFLGVVLAIPLVKLNKYYIIPYVIGYSSQFVGLLIYGLTLNVKWWDVFKWKKI